MVRISSGVGWEKVRGMGGDTMLVKFGTVLSSVQVQMWSANALNLRGTQMKLISKSLF